MSTPHDRLEELSPGKRQNLSTEDIMQLATRLEAGERIFCKTPLTPLIELVIYLSNRPLSHFSIQLEVWSPEQKIRLVFPLQLVPPLTVNPLTLEEVLAIFALSEATRWPLSGYSSSGPRSRL